MRDYYRLFSNVVSSDDNSNIKQLYNAIMPEYNAIFSTLEGMEEIQYYQNSASNILDEHAKMYNLNRTAGLESGSRTDLQLKNLITGNLLGREMSDNARDLYNAIIKMPGVIRVDIIPQRDDGLVLDGSWKLDGSEKLDGVIDENAEIRVTLDTRLGLRSDDDGENGDLQDIIKRAVSLGAGRGVDISILDISSSNTTATIPANTAGTFYITAPASGSVDFTITPAPLPAPFNIHIFKTSLVDDVNSGSNQILINHTTGLGAETLQLDSPRTGQTSIQFTSNSNNNQMNFPNGRYQYFYGIYQAMSQNINIRVDFTRSI